MAGERSGDLHGGNLISALFQKNPSIDLVGWGGDYMQSKGMHLLKHYREIAFMGFWEVAKNIFKIKAILNQCKQDILAQNPAIVVLIDYGGFNMKIAEFCYENKIEIHFYISPKVWAWNIKRAIKIKKYVSKLYCILPFEPTFFKQFDLDTQYVGNPVVDAITAFKQTQNLTMFSEKPLVAILPGSRKQEVVKMLGLMLEVVPKFPNHKFVVTAVDNLPKTLYQSAKDLGVEVVYDQTYALLNTAKAALVTSGTATLETAVFGVPQAVCYKTSSFNYRIAKSFIKVPYISLVNLIANKEVVQELIQSRFTSISVAEELEKLLNNKEYISQIKEGYGNIIQTLGPKNASETVADALLASLKK